MREIRGCLQNEEHAITLCNSFASKRDEDYNCSVENVCYEDYCNGATIPSTDEYENPWMIACIWIMIVLLFWSFCLFLLYNYKKMKKIQTRQIC